MPQISPDGELGPLTRILFGTMGVLEATLTSFSPFPSTSAFLFPPSHHRLISLLAQKLDGILSRWDEEGCPELLGGNALSRHLRAEEWLWMIFSGEVIMEDAFSERVGGRNWHDCGWFVETPLGTMERV